MASNEQYLKNVTDYAEQLEALKKKEVAVGIPASKNDNHVDEDGTTIKMAELGAVHEYGSPDRKIPQRSFLRVPLQANGNKLIGQISKDLKFSKMDIDTALGGLGAKGQSVVLEAFKTQGSASWKPLKPSTIKGRRKGTGGGSDKPLIDTGQLRQSITWEVRDKTKG